MPHTTFHFVLKIDGAPRIEAVDARSRTAAYNALFRTLNECGLLFQLDSIQLMESP